MNGTSGVARMGAVGTGPLTSLQRAFSLSARACLSPQTGGANRKRSRYPGSMTRFSIVLGKSS